MYLKCKCNWISRWFMWLDHSISTVHIELTSITLVKAEHREKCLFRSRSAGKNVYRPEENYLAMRKMHINFEIHVHHHVSVYNCRLWPWSMGRFRRCRQKLTISRYSSLSNTRKIFTRQRRVSLYLSDASLTTNNNYDFVVCACADSTTMHTQYRLECEHIWKIVAKASCDLKQYKRRTISISVRLAALTYTITRKDFIFFDDDDHDDDTLLAKNKK